MAHLHVVSGPQPLVERLQRTGERRYKALDVRRPVPGEGAGPLAIVCSWCGALVMEGRGPASHGICTDCMDERHPARVAIQALGAVAFIPALFLVLSVFVP